MKHKGIRSGIIGLGLIVFAGALLIACLKLTAASADTMPELRTGDIIFQTSASAQSSAILVASGSKYSHMGLVEKRGNGRVFVIEASGPVRETPLQDWIDKGIAGRVTVKRFENLDNEQTQTIRETARSYYGRAYDPYFYFGNNALYCSELVYLAYKEAGIELGKPEKLAALNTGNPLVKSLIEKRWHKHPLCRDRAKEDCMAQVMEQDLITPESIANDKRLQTVYSNY